MNDREKEYQRKYREANKEKRRAYMRDWNQKRSSDYAYAQRAVLRSKTRKSELRFFVENLKVTVGCRDCGEKHPACLDYHHLDEDLKILSISQMCRRGRSKENILEETKKCIVLCSNCHRKRHYEQKHGKLSECSSIVNVDEAVQTLRELAEVLNKHRTCYE